MLEMTNRFLETQQNVMLAYLQANGRGSYQPQLTQINQPGQQLPAQTMHQPMQQPMQQTIPAVAVQPTAQNSSLRYTEQAPVATYDAGSNGNGSNGTVRKTTMVMVATAMAWQQRH
jgi:hypothetical protein